MREKLIEKLAKLLHDLPSNGYEQQYDMGVYACMKVVHQHEGMRLAPERPIDCRTAFEARRIPHLDLKRNEDGSYRYEAAQMAFRDFADGWRAARADQAESAVYQQSYMDLANGIPPWQSQLEKRLKLAVGGLRSIAYGDASSWPNCSAREVAKQTLKDCGGEKLLANQTGTAGAATATLPLSIQWCPEAGDWYCPDLGLHGSQLPPATRAMLPPAPGGFGSSA